MLPVSLRAELPHSETFGSKPVRRLPENIVATQRPSSLLRSLGIHHMLLNFLLGNLKTTKLFLNDLFAYNEQIQYFYLPVAAFIFPGWKAGFHRHDLTYR